MEEKRKFRFKDLGALLKNVVLAILKGELLLRLKIGRYFIHIASCFAVVAVTIWVSLMIDSAMTRVQKNRRTMDEQQNEIASLTFKLSKATRRSEVEVRLQELGSALENAEKPAKKIE